MSKIHYSILMPVYNGRNYFGSALNSAIEASTVEDEIVVVEDGSTDGGVEEIVHQARSKGFKIQYHVKDNGGVASALNLGLEKATREYFAWLSHDDLFLPNRFAFDRELRKVSPEAVTYSDFYTLDMATERLALSVAGQFNKKSAAACLIANTYIHGCSLSAPLSLLTKYGGFDEGLLFVQDYDLWLKMMRDRALAYNPVATVISRQHPMQDSKRSENFSRRKQEYRSLVRRNLDQFGLARDTINPLFRIATKCII